MGLIKLKDSPYWYLDYRERGQRKRVSSGTTNKKKAQELYDELRWRLRGEKLGIARMPDVQFSAFFETYLSRKRDKLTLENDRLNGTKHLLPRFGNLKLSQITTNQIEDMKSELVDDGYSPVTINRQLALLRHILNLAVKWEHLAVSPFKTTLLKEHGRERVILHEEEEKLLSKCGGNLATFVRLAFATGARPGELKKLNWEDVDFENRIITFRRTKNGYTRKVSMNDEAWNALWDQPYLGEGSVIGLTTVAKAFRKACIAAGLPTKGKDRITPHSIRHTVATRLAWAGVDIPTIAAILGHSQVVTLMKYAHPGNQVEAMKKLSKQ